MRVRIRGVVEPGGAGFFQSRRDDGRWDLWNLAVRLRPWRPQGGKVQTSSLYLSRRTRLPHFVWQLLFRRRSIVEVLVDEGPEQPDRGRLVAWLGLRSGLDLRAAHTEWRGGRTLEDQRFGRFRFDERIDTFEAEADWLGTPVKLSLGTNAEGETAVAEARRVFADAGRYDSGARHAAVAELLPLKNEGWLEDGEPPLTAQQFSARMRLETVAVEPGPYVQLYFDDGDLFFGHTIIVTFDEANGETWAEIAG